MKAWAIVIDGQIDARTIMPTSVGAMVNFLAAYAGITALSGTSDSTIINAFDEVREGCSTSIECCEVEIRRVLQ